MGLKILLSAVVLSVAPTASAVATVKCHGGLIQDQNVHGDVVVTGGTCSIISSSVMGDVRVLDSSDIVLLNNDIAGTVRVVRTSGQKGDSVANIIANTVRGGNVTVRGYAVANVIENETKIGSIRVDGNTEALVHKNISEYHLICRDNTELSAFVNFARKTLSCE